MGILDQGQASPLLDPVIAMLNAKRAQAMQGMPSLGDVVSNLPSQIRDVARQYQKVGSDIGQKGFFQWFNEQPPLDTKQLGMDAAMGFMPMGMAGSIRAFHGSPHSFEKFDAGKIGTGEGAQSYGHGLYFAGNEEAAKAYRNTFASKKMRDWGTPGQQDRDEMYKYLIDSEHGATPEARATAKALHEQMMSKYARMYEVNIAAEPHQLLDWDKPLSEQAPNIRAAAAEHGYDQPGDTGQTWHRSLSEGGDPSEVSAYLQQQGIHGLQFLDQGSRAAGAGTRNYTIWNPDIITILRKYGIAPTALTAGAAAGLGGQQEQ